MGKSAAPAVPAANASFKARAGWVLFDFANQPFLVLGAFVFAPYFSSEIVGDSARGQALWGYMLAAVGIFVALSSPVLGAIADAAGRRKPWIFVFSAMTVFGTGALWFASPGRADPALFALAMFALAAVGAELAAVFNNAMLPSLTSRERMGRLSGIGWGMGYAGGLIALLTVLSLIILPAEPAFGLARETFGPERVTGPFAALWLVLFLMPFFLYTPDGRRPLVSAGAAVRDGLARLRGTVRAARSLKTVGRFLLARMAYQDGLSALMNFAALYGAGLFGWRIETLALFAILLTIAAVPGSFLGGWLDDRIGPKRTVELALGGLVVAALGVLSVTPERVLFVIDVAAAPPDAAPFASPAERAFLAFGLLAGLCVGPAQSASRTMMARLAPPQMMTEFFGLYAFSGKATAFLAPLLIGLATTWSGSQRPALLVPIALVLVGLLLLRGVPLVRTQLVPEGQTRP